MTDSGAVAPHPPRPESTAARDALQTLYQERRDEITTRLQEFRAIWREGSDEDLFAEMVFCLCAVQTSARASDQVVRRLRVGGLLLRGSRRRVREVLRGGYVRFHETKSGWIVEARTRFMEPRPALRQELEGLAGEPPALRDWLEREVLGLGPKEASHYLRNIGLGENLAILDRHILSNLQELGVVDSPLPSLTRSRYHAIEQDLRSFCGRVGIPVGHMDLLLWAKETGFVFK
jgi:N-glycosylase/DNA lyase